ncbi:Cell division integral membrane protein, YggT and half-length relatives, partial [Pseudomonas sp. FG-3G]
DRIEHCSGLRAANPRQPVPADRTAALCAATGARQLLQPAVPVHRQGHPAIAQATAPDHSERVRPGHVVAGTGDHRATGADGPDPAADLRHHRQPAATADLVDHWRDRAVPEDFLLRPDHQRDPVLGRSRQPQPGRRTGEPDLRAGAGTVPPHRAEPRRPGYLADPGVPGAQADRHAGDQQPGGDDHDAGNPAVADL